MAQAIQRGNAYQPTGADCIFAISVNNKETIADLVREIAAPLNILARHDKSPFGDDVLRHYKPRTFSFHTIVSRRETCCAYLTDGAKYSAEGERSKK
ncbi:MAG: isocitrate lyase/phosphoenolpyruvate mutase family protein [Anaerolineales bacterium]|nr:isocitrate lyase/phosphoenolpyruvate mutase family protein [Anaerolineales bacterium]